jgi:hypothetical protein
MAGSLIKIDEEIVTSAVASVTLGGTDWDSSYDVYMVKANAVIPSLDSRYIKARVTEGGTPNTTANYDSAYKELKSYEGFSNRPYTNQDHWRMLTTGTGTGEQTNFTMYLFNFNSTSEYAFQTLEETLLTSSAGLAGWQGGGVCTITGTARDGINFFFDSGNIASGTFTLYGLKK